MSDQPDNAAEAAIDMNDARPRRWGWWLLIVGFGGFLAWAMLAPLDAGVAAPGTVTVSGNRKAVQSLVNGKINAILAKDGDEVAPGQLLVRLDDTQSRSQLNIAQGQWYSALAAETRLVAERLGAKAPVFPKELDPTDPRAVAATQLQSQLFATRRQALRSELSAMAENIQGIELQTRGMVDSQSAKEEQLRLLREQLKNQRALADEGFLPRNRVLEQERVIAGLLGTVAEDVGRIGRSRQAIAEVRARMVTREQEFRKEVEAQLADVQRDASALRSRLEALQFDVASMEIKAPSGGVVLGLAVHTVGGVVAAGNPMMEIVPKGERLVIEAQIAPHLIDKVKAGLPVDILFVAFNQASTPHIPGTVIQVSADILADARQNVSYFKATVQVTDQGMALLQKYEVRAGMPVEVFVRTGERTAMNYLLKPLRDRMNRALTEP